MPTIDVQVPLKAVEDATAAAGPRTGFEYPPGLLDSAPCLSPKDGAPCNAPSEPIRILDPSAFQSMHLSHLVSHAPDSVLFPFLHGLEGGNNTQNTFFRNSAGQRRLSLSSDGTLVAAVPKYRGLIWVLCDDDLVDAPRHHREEVAALLSRNVSFEDISDDEAMSCSDDEFEEIETEEEDEMPASALSDSASMDLDVGVRESDTDSPSMNEDAIPDTTAAIDILEKGDKDAGIHMHPVQQRRAGLGLETANLGSHTKEDSGLTSSSSPESSLFSPDFDSYTTDGSLQSGLTSPEPECVTSNGISSSSVDSNSSHPKRRMSNKEFSPPPAILTGSFRPGDLLHYTSAEGEHRAKTPHSYLEDESDDLSWEFAPLKVPDGISLRNFGIQVPIYATLSDIVVYSPKGNTPNARRLARKIELAQRKKRAERAQRLGVNLASWSKYGSADSKQDPYDGIVGAMDIDMESPIRTSFDNTDDEEELLHYRTFILDATSDDLRRQVPHLVIHMRSGKGVGASASASAASSGPSANDVLETQKRESQDFGNTVDFSVREREEMKDLTQASEILSLAPAPPSVNGANHSASNLAQGSRTMSFALSGSPPSPAPILNSAPYVAISHLSTTTTATHWEPSVGQVFLGNTNDLPLPNPVPRQNTSTYSTPFDDVAPLPANSPLNPAPDNLPSESFGYDVCIECHDMMSMPTATHLRSAEDHLKRLEIGWVEHCLDARAKQLAALPPDQQVAAAAQKFVIPPRPPPNVNSVIHLPLPASPQSTMASCTQLVNILKFLDRWIRPCTPVAVPEPVSVTPESPSESLQDGADQVHNTQSGHSRRWSAVSSFFPAFINPSNPTSRARSMTSPEPPAHLHAANPQLNGTSLSGPRFLGASRPLKVLFYSSDGYTESSVPALCLLMVVRNLSLPEAYIELQVEKKRSFYVYSNDLPILRRVQNIVSEERRIYSGVKANGTPSLGGVPISSFGQTLQQGNRGSPTPPPESVRAPLTSPPPYSSATQSQSRPSAKSVSFAQAPIVPSRKGDPDQTSSSPPTPVPSQHSSVSQGAPVYRRPRAITSPPNMFGMNHQAWFNDPRFDGSFPSRILPFLYLGNLAHASNVYMLHALGITHVVSVGECALVPPANHAANYQATSSSVPSTGFHYPHGGPQYHGGINSLWFEEKEGRIKVLDIKGVCDDGIDTLEPQLEPICDWIDEARRAGGHVLVHCRVGVSRSATVTIAYVMKHLNLPLVDAYLVVRSRRLSVLIQPNMRLLYNLCGWEIRLAKERAGNDPDKLKSELSRSLSWPYLAKEVHALNEKYLH